ncbi:hypothetical protein BDR06DRAFT_157374 [Suillus hirtellus]|nr:hypothetical protein BDR06DRAFT_157374 [Suillus hirtellus]
MSVHCSGHALNMIHINTNIKLSVYWVLFITRTSVRPKDILQLSFIVFVLLFRCYCSLAIQLRFVKFGSPTAHATALIHGEKQGRYT